MISVNQKFIDSCNSDFVLSQLKIRVSTNKVGTVLCTLNDDEFNISSNSVEKQASSGAVCNIGGVCSNRIKIIINQKGIEKLDAVNGFKKNNVLHLIQWNRVDDVNQNPVDYSENLDHSENETGKCDLGFYYISEIKNNYYDCEITAYDGMLAFEKNLTIAQLKYMMTNSKTVDQWLAYFCTLVNDSNFNISYTDNADVTCNDGVSFTLSDDSSFDKIRDAISQLAMLKMAYATIDTQGNLTLKQAIKTNTSTYDDTVDNEYMFNSDNEVIESVVKYFYTSVAGFEYENNYTEQQGRNEINLYLEENKFLRGFEPYNGTGLTSQTLTCLRNMSLEVMGYSFYSCECDINERPYIELGDNIEVERKLVDQQGQVSTITLPLVVDSVSHEIGASTHLTSSSTVGTNEGSNTKTRINSQPKDPSSRDILDILKSPVIKYSDTTATVLLRLDNDEIADYSEEDCFNDLIDSDFSYFIHTYSQGSQYYRNYYMNDTTLPEVVKERELNESLNHKYYFNTSIVDSDIKKVRINYDSELTINSEIQNIVGLHLPFAAPNSSLLGVSVYDAEIKGVYLGSRQDKTDYDNSQGLFPSYPWSNRAFNVGFRQKEGYTPLTYTQQGGEFVEGSYIRDTTINAKYRYTLDNHIYEKVLDASRHEITESINVKNTTRVQKPGGTSTLNANSLRKRNGYSVYNSLYYKHGIETQWFWVNPFFPNFKTVAKKLMAIDSNLDYLLFKIEYTNDSQQQVELYVHLYDFFEFLNFGRIYAGQYAVDYFHKYGDNYDNLEEVTNNLSQTHIANINSFLDNLLDNIHTNVSHYFIETTYLTSHSPLSDNDKKHVDLGLVTQNDLSELREQVQENTRAIENLEKYVNEVNADLQDSKQDITQNTQNITALDTREAQDVRGLDTRVTANEGDITSLDSRVTALEQGGGGGGGTFVVANPTGQATADLTKLQVGSDIYSIPGAPNVLQVTSKPSDNVGANYDIALIYRTINNVKVATELYSKMLLWFKQAEFESSVNSSYSDVASFDYTTIFDDVVAYANYTHGTGNKGNGLWTKGTITLFAKYTESGSEVQLTEGTDYTLTWTSTTQGSTKFLLEFEPNTYIYSLRIHLQNCYRCSVTCNYLIDNQILHDILNP